MQAINLKTEYLVNPLGIDIRKPRLFWHCQGGTKQTAYRILANTADSTVAWDSGKVQTSRMTHIPYEGTPLKSRDIMIWCVMLWDENHEPGEWSEPATFEMGLLEPDDWTARWITADLRPNKKVRYPVDCFRKVFSVRDDLKQARLYSSACGVYEIHLNGEKALDFCFAPGYTDYRKRLQYQVSDITSLVHAGENVLTAELADGWYRGSIGALGYSHVFGKETKLLCQLELNYADGTRQVIGSDSSFAWSNDGPIRFADLKDGEVVVANHEPGYHSQARETTFALTPVAANNVPVREKEQFLPAMVITPSGAKVLDFGQNIAGVLAFRLQARDGQRVLMRFGEILDERGEFTQTNIQVTKPKVTPLQQVAFICRDGVNDYKTRFAVFGFRYVLVETEVAWKPDDFKAIAVYSDMEPTGDFTCSNPLLNRYVENTRWSMKGNFLDVPTDCPTRERAGWTGDAQVFFKTGSYLMNTAPFFRKWLLDLQDRQTRRGKVHCIVPSVGNELYLTTLDGCVGWADAAIYVPWRYWQIFGDRQILEDCYPSMKRYAQFMIRRTGRTGILGKSIPRPWKQYTYNTGMHFGEWLEPKDVIVETHQDISKPRPEEATAYLVYSMTLMTEIAMMMGCTADAEQFARYAAGAKAAYSHLFAPNGVIDTDRQAKLVRPLALGILDGETRQLTEQRLLAAIEKRDYHVGTGFLSTPFLLPVLSAMGRHDIAWRMLETETAPSWLAEVRAGATTVWENWDGSASQNHYSAGSVCEWLFTTAGGIEVSGENEFTIAPKPGGSLSYAQTHYSSIYGEVSSNWEKHGDGWKFSFSLPANTTATIILPNGERHLQAAGQASFVLVPGTKTKLVKGENNAGN